MKLYLALLLSFSADVDAQNNIHTQKKYGGLQMLKSRKPVELPWADLSQRLGRDTRFIDTTYEDYVKECVPEFRDKVLADRSLWDLVDQPSGLCMGALYCGFESCNPALDETTTIVESLEALGESAAVIDSFVNNEESPYDLPPKVLFPRTAADIVAAVQFAADHSLELSVKNSGHSFAGASTKKGTLLINMYEFKKYANIADFETLSPVECIGEEEIVDDLSNQPCQLALARGKGAYQRVGGGESWSDAYRAVKAFNDAQDTHKYLIVGGASGGVSPMGWTWQGGLSGTTAGGLYGFGADQVLQIEAILPSGTHIRFGPTEWEDEDGYEYPKTTGVTGVCNKNPSEEDESQWEWETCDESINFDDLWFAFRGAGMGTYGVVTSVFLQLHNHLTFHVIGWNIPMFADQCGVVSDSSEKKLSLARTYYKFSIDYLLDPKVLDNVPEDISNSCGTYSLNSNIVPNIYCYGDDADEVLFNAWAKYISSHIEEDLGNASFTEDEIDAIRECPMKANPSTTEYVDYATFMLIQEGPNAGKAKDSPPPSVCTGSDSCRTYANTNVLAPKEWALEHKDDLVQAMVNGFYWYDTEIFDFEAPIPIAYGPYIAFGGKLGISHDQATSISDAYRNAGVMLTIPSNSVDLRYRYLAHEAFLKMYNVTETGDDFPAYLGANHVGPLLRGPLKEDWLQPCSKDFTLEEMDEKCISLQEVVWGTKILQRLEKIKEDIDPHYMFDCTSCVGNNRKNKKSDGEIADFVLLSDE